MRQQVSDRPPARPKLSQDRSTVLTMTAPADVPPEVLDRLRPICMGLLEAYEEAAWVGIRWRIRKRTFAHVLSVDPDHQMAYARAANTDQPLCVLTFHSAGDEIAGLVSSGPPFFKPAWSPSVVGMVLDGGEDWEEIAELVTESYRVLAPKRLAALVEGPAGAIERPRAG